MVLFRQMSCISKNNNLITRNHPWVLISDISGTTKAETKNMYVRLNGNTRMSHIVFGMLPWLTDFIAGHHVSILLHINVITKRFPM